MPSDPKYAYKDALLVLFCKNWWHVSGLGERTHPEPTRRRKGNNDWHNKQKDRQEKKRRKTKWEENQKPPKPQKPPNPPKQKQTDVFLMFFLGGGWVVSGALGILGFLLLVFLLYSALGLFGFILLVFSLLFLLLFFFFIFFLFHGSWVFLVILPFFFLLVFLSCLFCLDLVGVWVLILSLLRGGWTVPGGLLRAFWASCLLGDLWVSSSSCSSSFFFVFHCLASVLVCLFYPPKTNKKETGNKE